MILFCKSVAVYVKLNGATPVKVADITVFPPKQIVPLSVLKLDCGGVLILIVVEAAIEQVL